MKDNNKLIEQAINRILGNSIGYKIVDYNYEGIILTDPHKKKPSKEKFEVLLQQQLLFLSKENKINEINSACKKDIIGGFLSSALGSEYIYQSEPVDQINLMGVVIAGNDSIFKCGEKNSEGNITWSYKKHTIDQLKQVLSDGKKHKLALLEKANDLKNKVRNAKTVDEVKNIKWD